MNAHVHHSEELVAIYDMGRGQFWLPWFNNGHGGWFSNVGLLGRPSFQFQVGYNINVDTFSQSNAILISAINSTDLSSLQSSSNSVVLPSLNKIQKIGHNTYQISPPDGQFGLAEMGSLEFDFPPTLADVTNFGDEPTYILPGSETFDGENSVKVDILNLQSGDRIVQEGSDLTDSNILELELGGSWESSHAGRDAGRGQIRLVEANGEIFIEFQEGNKETNVIRDWSVVRADGTVENIGDINFRNIAKIAGSNSEADVSDDFFPTHASVDLLKLLPLDGEYFPDASSVEPTHVAIKSGDWNDPTTWNSGTVPGEGAIVHIPQHAGGSALVVTASGDVSQGAHIFMVRLDGELNVTAENNVATTMTVDTIFSTASGALVVDADDALDGTVDIALTPFDLIGGFKENWSQEAIEYYTDVSDLEPSGVNDGTGVLGRHEWDGAQLSLGIIGNGRTEILGQEKSAHAKYTAIESFTDQVSSALIWAADAIPELGGRSAYHQYVRNYFDGDGEVVPWLTEFAMQLSAENREAFASAATGVGYDAATETFSMEFGGDFQRGQALQQLALVAFDQQEVIKAVMESMAMRVVESGFPDTTAAVAELLDLARLDGTPNEGGFVSGVVLEFLENDVDGWNVGDTLVVSGSTLTEHQSDLKQQDEIRTITAIEANDGVVRITLDRDFEYQHIIREFENADGDILTVTPSVANMTRNVVIRSGVVEGNDDFDDRRAVSRNKTESELNSEGVRPTDENVYNSRVILTEAGLEEGEHWITQRAHTMFFHTDNATVSNALFFGLGRTDKSQSLTDNLVDGAAVLAEDNINQRGRYAVHVHQAGVGDGAEGASIENSVVWGSPGWGYAHHDSHAVLNNNVSFDVVGAGFISETGNETGTWTNNLAIRSVSALNRVANSEGMTSEKSFSRINHDFGFQGEGYWLEGRGIDLIDNKAFNSSLAGFWIGSEGKDGIQFRVDQLPDRILGDLDRDGDGLVNAEDVPLFMTGSEAAVNRYGIFYNGKDKDGSGDRVENDARSVIENFLLYEVGSQEGTRVRPIFTFDTSNVTIRDGIMAASDQQVSSVFGLTVYHHSSDIVSEGVAFYGPNADVASYSSNQNENDSFGDAALENRGIIAIAPDGYEFNTSPSYWYEDRKLDYQIEDNDTSYFDIENRDADGQTGGYFMDIFAEMSTRLSTRGLSNPDSDIQGLIPADLFSDINNVRVINFALPRQFFHQSSASDEFYVVLGDRGDEVAYDVEILWGDIVTKVEELGWSDAEQLVRYQELARVFYGIENNGTLDYYQNNIIDEKGTSEIGGPVYYLSEAAYVTPNQALNNRKEIDNFYIHDYWNELHEEMKLDNGQSAIPDYHTFVSQELGSNYDPMALINEIKKVDEGSSGYIFDVDANSGTAFSLYGYRSDSVGVSYDPFIDIINPYSDMPFKHRVNYGYDRITRAANDEGYVTVDGIDHVIMRDYYSDRVTAEQHIVRFAARDGLAKIDVSNAIQIGTYKDIQFDRAIGGAHDDHLIGSDEGSVLIANFGDDTVVGGAQNDYIAGGDGNDVMTGGDGADIFRIDIGDGHDTITDFEIGVDQLIIDGDVIEVDAATAVDRDVVFTYERAGIEGSVRLENVGTDGIVSGTDNRDNIRLGYTDPIDGDTVDNSGNIIETGEGNDTVYDGAGDDVITFGNGSATIYNGAGDDIVWHEQTSLGHHSERTYFIDGPGVDTYHGGVYITTFTVTEAGINYAYANGDGRNTVKFSNNVSEGLTIDLTDMSNSTGIAKDNFVEGFRRLDATQHNDTIIVDHDWGYIRGGAGDDIIILRSEADENAIQSRLYGGDGADIFRFEIRDGVAQSLNDFEVGVDKIDVSALNIYSIDQLKISYNSRGYGSIIDPTGDRIGLAGSWVKNAHNDQDLYGLTVDDFIFAPFDPDNVIDTTIDGTDGNDNMEQGYIDPLDGKVIGRGDDKIVGGLGNDTLDGGVGRDTYIIRVGDGQDVIKDTGVHSQTDTIVFEGRNFDASVVTAVDAGTIEFDFGDGDSLRVEELAHGWRKIENYEFEDQTIDLDTLWDFIV